MRRTSPQFKFILVVWLVLSQPIAWALGQTNEAPKSAPSPPASHRTAEGKPWEHVVLVGASVTAGFVQSEMLGGTNTEKLRLDRYVDAALLMPHERVENLASAFLFLQPETLARGQLAQALQAKPTLVVGIDFLFWFCYGSRLTSPARLQLFDRGLKLLETVPCPLILGDIPDASASVNLMLSADQIPTAEVRKQANLRLQAWAVAHSQVTILPLTQFLRTVLANQALTVHGRTLPVGQTRILLQNDKLHPTPQGCAVLTVAMLEAFQNKQHSLPEAQVLWNPYEVFRRGLKAKPAYNQASAKN